MTGLLFYLALTMSSGAREGRMVLAGYEDMSVRMVPTGMLGEMMKIHVRLQ